MNQKSVELTEAVEKLLEPQGYELVQLRIVPRGRSVCVQILIDRAEGNGAVTVTDCVQVSKALSIDPVMDGLLPGKYVLEVSSPGVDRPLTRPAHYRRFEGEQVVISLQAASTGQKSQRGIIAAVGERTVTIVSDNDERVEIPFEEIQSAHLKVDPWKPRARS